MTKIFERLLNKKTEPLVYINYQMRTGPWGGGNQFLKALKEEFIRTDNYTSKVRSADFVIFNSHHNLKELKVIKSKYPKKIYIHRIDGPISLIRGDDVKTDQNIFNINQQFADISIFQSHWSLEQTLNLGWQPIKPKVILNASDEEIFNSTGKNRQIGKGKIKIVSTSWSNNPRKGGLVYKWLDENLDWDLYDYTFVGRSSEHFNNIKMVDPVGSLELAKILRDHDVYITASRKDPCSNSHIEAIACGLPSVYLQDGGHPEIARDGGIGFLEKEEIPSILGEIIDNYNFYVNAIKPLTMTNCADDYLSVFNSVFIK